MRHPPAATDGEGPGRVVDLNVIPWRSLDPGEPTPPGRAEREALTKWFRGRAAVEVALPRGYHSVEDFYGRTTACDRQGRRLAGDIEILIDLDELRRPSVWQLDRQAEAGREAVTRRLRHEGWSAGQRR